MPCVDVNHVRLHYETYGGPGPAVLFLHGLGSSAADWALQVQVFAERYGVITLDLRAHGQSSLPDGRFTIETMADDVGALLAQLDEPAAHVVGLSLGGCAALALALRHPARVRSLVLVNTFARYQPAGLRGVGRTLTRLWLLAFAPMPAVANYIARGLFPGPEQRPLYEAAVASLGKNSRRTYLATLLAVRRFDVRKQLGQIRCPTLIVAGDRDRTVPLSSNEYLHRSIPGAQMRLVPNSGHATPCDQHEIFNRAVLEFLAAH